MGAIRIRALAQELGLTKEEVLEAAKAAGMPALGNASLLTEEEVDKIRAVLFPEDAMKERKAVAAQNKRIAKAKRDAEERDSKIEEYVDESALDDMVATIEYRYWVFDEEENADVCTGESKTETYKGADEINEAFGDYEKAYHMSGEGDWWGPERVVITWRGREVVSESIVSYTEESLGAWLLRAIWENGGDFFADQDALAAMDSFIAECYKRQSALRRQGAQGEGAAAK